MATAQEERELRSPEKRSSSDGESSSGSDAERTASAPAVPGDGQATAPWASAAALWTYRRDPAPFVELLNTAQRDGYRDQMYRLPMILAVLAATRSGMHDWHGACLAARPLLEKYVSHRNVFPHAFPREAVIPLVQGLRMAAAAAVAGPSADGDDDAAPLEHGETAAKVLRVVCSTSDFRPRGAGAYAHRVCAAVELLVQQWHNAFVGAAAAARRRETTSGETAPEERHAPSFSLGDIDGLLANLEDARERAVQRHFRDSSVHHAAVGFFALRIVECCEAVPSTAPAEIAVACSDRRSRAMSAALEGLETAAKIDSRSLAYLSGVIAVLRRQGRHAEAKGRLAEFCERNLDDVFALTELLNWEVDDAAAGEEHAAVDDGAPPPRGPRDARSRCVELADRLVQLDERSEVALRVFLSEAEVAARGAHGDAMRLGAAKVYAARADVGEREAWPALLSLLRRLSPRCIEPLYVQSGRYCWWPDAHFRSAHVARREFRRHRESCVAKALIAQAWEVRPQDARMAMYAAEVRQLLRIESLKHDAAKVGSANVHKRKGEHGDDRGELQQELEDDDLRVWWKQPRWRRLKARRKGAGASGNEVVQ